MRCDCRQVTTPLHLRRSLSHNCEIGCPHYWHSTPRHQTLSYTRCHCHQATRSLKILENKPCPSPAACSHRWHPTPVQSGLQNRMRCACHRVTTPLTTPA